MTDHTLLQRTIVVSKGNAIFKLMKAARMSYVSDSYCLIIIASSTGTVRKTSSLSFASSWLSHFLHGFLTIYFLIWLRDSLVGFFFVCVGGVVLVFF